MGVEVLDVLGVGLRVDIEVELEEEEHITFEDVELGETDASNLGIEDVIIVSVFREFDGEQDGGDEKSVDAMCGEGELRVLLEQAIDVDEGYHNATLGTVGKLLHSSHVLRHRDVGDPRRVKVALRTRSDTRPARRSCGLCQGRAGFLSSAGLNVRDDSFQHMSHDGPEVRGRLLHSFYGIYIRYFGPALHIFYRSRGEQCTYLFLIVSCAAAFFYLIPYIPIFRNSCNLFATRVPKFNLIVLSRLQGSRACSSPPLPNCMDI